MPLLTLHLLRAAPGSSASSLLSAVRADSSIKVIVASKPHYTVISPQLVDRETLLGQAWDLLLLLQSRAGTLPAALRRQIAAEYQVGCGIPSRLLADYPARNAAMRQKPPPPPTGSLEATSATSGELPGGERLEVNRELLAFMEAFERQNGAHVPMTMLNLLSFHPGGKESYGEYGRAFVKVAGRRGGDAKLVGNVVQPPSSGSGEARGGATNPEAGTWDEVSIVHYPSIRSFCDMLAGKDYQEINEKHRLKALRDTFLLCTTETFDATPQEAAKL